LPLRTTLSGRPSWRRRHDRESDLPSARDAAAGWDPAHQTAGQAGAPQAERGEVDPTQDRASYNCDCGFVFTAAVSASVACPHCGKVQAW
jgi:hypothetical protein